MYIYIYTVTNKTEYKIWTLIVHWSFQLTHKSIDRITFLLCVFIQSSKWMKNLIIIWSSVCEKSVVEAHRRAYSVLVASSCWISKFQCTLLVARFEGMFCLLCCSCCVLSIVKVDLSIVSLCLGCVNHWSTKHWCSLGVVFLQEKLQTHLEWVSLQ